MKKLNLLLFIIVITNASFAQLYKSHKWDKKPTFEEITNAEKELSSFAIKEKHIIQYHQPLLGTLNLYETYHKIIRVNTDKGIARHNKVYIPMRGVKEIVDIKARVLFANGKTILLNKNNIKELENVKEYGNLKIFAIEGLEKNTQLEIIYTLNKNLSNLGSINIQQDYTIKNAEVIIRKPYNLNTKVKNYNGFPKLIEKQVVGNKIAYTAIAKNIAPMVDEPFSASKANKMKVVYLTTNGTTTISNEWNSFHNRIKRHFTNINPNNYKKIIKDFEKQKTIIKNKDSMVNVISNYISNNFTINKQGNPFEDLKTIYQNKKATELSIGKLYSCLFNNYQINYNIVFTSNRFYNKFDPDFFTNSNLSYMMFYFPKSEKYLCIAEKEPFLGYPPVRYSNNQGIFMSNSEYNFSNIKTADIDYTIMDRDIHVKVNTTEDYVEVKGTYNVSGYRAYNSRRAYQYLKDKNIERYKTMETSSGIEDVDFINFKATNTKITENKNNIPLTVNYTYNSEEVLEEVHDNYILNVGRLIGTQSELYQEEKRINPIELYNPNAYKYKITVEIPEGFKPKNLNELNINSTFNINNELGAHFISSYKQEKNIIIISISERYPKINIPISYYNNFKDVINSAFDFSKKDIIFIKN